MAFINEAQQEKLKEQFKGLDKNVKLIVFTQEMECQYCREARELMEEVSALSDKITLEVYDFVKDKEKVKEYNINKIPATVVEGEKDYGIRFYGIPAGYEFTTLVDDIAAVSKGDRGLSEETKTALGKLEKTAHIEVFVTLTCPYCPRTVELAHRLAIESELITADMVESAEFPALARKYKVMSVPKVVINGKAQFEGVLPEKDFVDNLMSAMEKSSKKDKKKKKKKGKKK
jgi:glutaredoxin-like protein